MNFRLFLILTCLSILPKVVLAEVAIAGPNDIKKFQEIMAKADVVHLNGAVIVEKTPGYQVKWNSSRMSPGLAEGQYGGNTVSAAENLVGGVNNAKQSLHVTALIPFFEFRTTEFPAKEIETVMVNGKPADCFLFLAGGNVNDAIETASQYFPDNKLFHTQLDPRAPLLFIDAGLVSPGDSLKIEYKTKPREYMVN